jgi:hypothetical protein
MAYDLVIEVFKTKEEVETFASCYNNQGEQNISIWLECRQSEGIVKLSSMSVVKPHNKWEDDTTLEMHINRK